MRALVIELVADQLEGVLRFPRAENLWTAPASEHRESDTLRHQVGHPGSAILWDAPRRRLKGLGGLNGP
jgi:hypothetical protein